MKKFFALTLVLTGLVISGCAQSDTAPPAATPAETNPPAATAPAETAPPAEAPAETK